MSSRDCPADCPRESRVRQAVREDLAAQRPPHQAGAPDNVSKKLPWSTGRRPLMLAPMQGLTHPALRDKFLLDFAPDAVFTEFVRVQGRSGKRLAASVQEGLRAHRSNTPLIVQLIGNRAAALEDAARQLEDSGCRHLNFNLGCPYGRMQSGATGGELLQHPEQLAPLLQRMRKAFSGSFSIKTRAGHVDPEQIFTLLELYQDCGADFIVLHPRTVRQEYRGTADHSLSCRVARQCRVPLIANGDITTAAQAHELFSDRHISGLMLGRGALADPWLFLRIRGRRPEHVNPAERRRELSCYLGDLLPAYLERFCGERQALMKLKDLLNFIPDADLQCNLGRLKRATGAARFQVLLEDLAGDDETQRRT